MNLSNIKKEFPIFNNKNLVYLDSANSSQKPQSVIDRINDFYSNEFSNVGRSVHALSIAATNNYENTRISVQKYINAKSKDEIVGMFSLNSDSTYSLKFDENNYSIAVLLDSINKITSKEFLKKLLTLEDYSNINFEILPEDFVYIVQSLPNDGVEQNIPDVGEISYNELTVEQKVSCLFENIDNDFLLANSIYKIDNSRAIDNYSISVDIEVI